jgi:uncharacterized protein YndB with AHSA1/START domain
MNIDRIEKQVVLRAPLDRVWRAISDSQEFGQWFASTSTARSSPARP